MRIKIVDSCAVTAVVTASKSATAVEVRVGGVEKNVRQVPPTHTSCHLIMGLPMAQH